MQRSSPSKYYKKGANEVNYNLSNYLCMGHLITALLVTFYLKLKLNSRVIQPTADFEHQSNKFIWKIFIFRNFSQFQLRRKTMSSIDNITSTSNYSVVGQEELFSELTPEQASVIEGGKFLYIDKIQAIKTGADPWGPDDTYITVNTQKIWGAVEMSAGQTRSVNVGTMFDNSAKINLFDKDGGFFGDDDYMGGFTVSQPTNGIVPMRVTGGGSAYDVYYSVFG